MDDEPGPRGPDRSQGRRALTDELDSNRALVRAERLGALQKLAHRLATFVAVVARELVDVHADEAVGELGVEAAAELERVLHRLLAVVEPGLDRLAQDVGELEQVLRADV